MPKPKRSFVCNQCGAVHLRWMGKCPDCGAWDALEETAAPTKGASGVRDPQRGLAEAWRWEVAASAGAHSAGALAAGGHHPEATEPAGLPDPPKAVPIGEIEALDLPRISTSISELDRVLGGGLVPGSAVLIGGEPGIGKSTLLLQAGAEIAAGPESGRRVLYVTSEESAQQAQMRAVRLGLPDDGGRLFVLADTNLARIFEQVRRVRPAVVIVDSVQMVYKSDLDASPGSVTQLRRCCMELVYLAKVSGCSVVLVGHVTKEGKVAGPRLLEHLVDSVLYFEGDQFHSHRLVRAVKNRYGNTLEIGLFEMTGGGLNPVTNPTGVVGFADGSRPKSDSEDDSSLSRSGSVVCPVMQGSRCFLVEIQALTATGILGAAKRRVSGLDANRLPMLIAVLEKHAELRLADQDVYASSVGGLKVIEPAADLAVTLAITAAHYDRALPAGTAAIGEVGLGGEIRRVNQIEQRLREVQRLGFQRVLIPAASGEEIHAAGDFTMRVEPIQSIGAAIEHLT